MLIVEHAQYNICSTSGFQKI